MTDRGVVLPAVLLVLLLVAGAVSAMIWSSAVERRAAGAFKGWVAARGEARISVLQALNTAGSRRPGSGPVVLIRAAGRARGSRAEAAVLAGLAAPGFGFVRADEGSEVCGIPLPSGRGPDLSALVAEATLSPPAGRYAGLAPRVIAGRCDQRLITNWGSPTQREAPCGSYYPVIHVQGDLAVASGEGQGALVVDGDLTVGGWFTFHGLVVVRGRIVVEGEGVRLLGALWAHGGLQGPDTAFLADSCVAGRSLMGISRLKPLSGRAWILPF